MNLKTVKVLLFALLALTLASLLIGGGRVQAGVFSVWPRLFAVGYAAACAAAAGAAPSAARRLGRSDGESCPHCGKALDPGARRPAE